MDLRRVMLTFVSALAAAALVPSSAFGLGVVGAYVGSNHIGATGGRATPSVGDRIPYLREGYFIAWEYRGVTRRDGRHPGFGWEIFQTWEPGMPFRLWAHHFYADGATPWPNDEYLWVFMGGTVNADGAWHVLEGRRASSSQWDCYCDGKLYYRAAFPYPYGDTYHTGIEVEADYLADRDNAFVGRQVNVMMRAVDGSWTMLDTAPAVRAWAQVLPSASPPYYIKFNRHFWDYQFQR